MSLYPVAPRAAAGFDEGGQVPGGLMVALRLEDVVPPLRSGGPLAVGDRSALVIGGQPGSGPVR